MRRRRAGDRPHDGSLRSALRAGWRWWDKHRQVAEVEQAHADKVGVDPHHEALWRLDLVPQRPANMDAQVAFLQARYTGCLAINEHQVVKVQPVLRSIARIAEARTVAVA